MALGPNKIKENRELIIKDLEKRIDQIIASQRSLVITIDTRKLPGIERVNKEIVEMYSKVGWKTHIVYDQKDGNYLSLEAK